MPKHLRRKSIVGIILVVCVLTSLISSSGNIFQPKDFGEITVILIPTQDADINENDPDTNSGFSSYLTVSQTPNKRTYLKFDFSTIPSEAIIQSATLQLYQSGYEGSGDRIYDLYLVNNSWNEDTITWNSVLGNITGDVFTTQATIDILEGWKSWDVTFDVTACLNNISLPDHPYHGWVIRDHNEKTLDNQARQFVSKDFPPAHQELWPKLEITYSSPPLITDINLITSDPLDISIGWENFSCLVTDNVAVDEVKLILVGDITTEYAMIKNDIGYSCNISIQNANEYIFYIWANDSSDNIAITEPESLNLPLNEDVDTDGKVHFMDLIAVSEAYNDEGPNGWIREDIDNNGVVHFMDLMAISLYYNQEWN
jgi:hypothetical protein